jgi:hypothetical protein
VGADTVTVFFGDCAINDMSDGIYATPALVDGRIYCGR